MIKIIKKLAILFRLKVLAIVSGLLLIADLLMFMRYGDSYTERFAFTKTIILVLELYIIFGFALRLALKLKNIRARKILTVWVLSFLAVYFLNVFGFISDIDQSVPARRLLAGLLEIAIVVFLLLPVPIVGERIVRFKLYKNKKFLAWLAFAIGVLFFGGLNFTLLVKLNERITKIEMKLGGPKRIGCNENDSVGKVRQSVVRIIGGEAEGSGFAIRSGGIILTNFHVIEFEPSPKVILPDNTFDTAEVLLADKNADLAIIKINKDLPAITWGNSQELSSAEEILAIGFPLGGQLPGEASVNKGSLSGIRRSKDVGVDYLQTDITLTGGVSGGPMINVCGEVVGINTAGLAGMGLGISADSIKQKWLEMATSKDSLKDVQRIVFEPEKSPLEAVKAFYNYLKARKLEKAFELLSDNFKKGYDFEYWKKGYEPLLDTTVIKIENDKTKENRIMIKLSTKDLVDEEIVYKYFEGYWDIKRVDDRWLLWDPSIKEVERPDFYWFYE